MPNKNSFQLVASIAAASKLPAGSNFITWSELTPKYVSVFSEAADGVWPLPPLSEDDASKLVTHYHDLMVSIGAENGRDSVWWYTWTLSKDRFHSSVLADLELTTRFQKACERGLPEQAVMLCQDPYLATALLDIARHNGLDTRVAVSDRLFWERRRFRMRVTPLISGIKTCARFLSVKSRLKYLKTSLGQAQQTPERTILVTWIKGQNLLDSGPADDTYFGPLPEFMVGPNHSITIFGDLVDGVPEEVPQKQAGYPTTSLSPVLTAASLVPFQSLVRAFFRGSFSRLALGHALDTEPPYVGPLIKRDFHGNRESIVHGLLVESGLSGLVSTLRPTQIIHMCENNPWERACVRAAASMTPMPQVTGYMHCAVILSHPKILITEKEKALRPRPSKLICTGARARDIMVSFGGHSPDEVIGACSLRHRYLGATQPRTRLNQPIRNILVVLEGLPTMAHFVRFVYDSLDGEERYRTVVRPHPAYSIDRILDDAGIFASDFKTLKLSEQSHIAQDFEDADLVLYQGSTAAMEAGYLGIPLVHYKQPNILTDDPLFETTNLKKVAATRKELLGAIEEFSSLDQGQYLEQSKMLRQYIDEYLTTPGPEHASFFMRDSEKVAVLD